MSESSLVVVILAAGGSRRLGRPKQLEPIANQPLIRRQARIALAADIGPVGVVLGCEYDACAAALVGLNVTILHNDAWVDGLSSSLGCAVTFARARNAAGLLILLGDQFGLTADDLRSVATVWRMRGDDWTIATRHPPATPGPPAILPRHRFDALASLHGDVGARAVLAASQPIDLLELTPALIDLDDEADAARLKQLAE